MKESSKENRRYARGGHHSIVPMLRLRIVRCCRRYFAVTLKATEQLERGLLVELIDDLDATAGGNVTLPVILDGSKIDTRKNFLGGFYWIKKL